MKANRILTLIAALVILTVFQGMALADSSFELDTPPLEINGEIGILVQFHNTLTNTGTSDDIYRVSFVKNAPADWAATLCAGQTCYPPFILEVDVPLAVGESINLDMDLTPLSDGQGSVSLNVHSLNDPLLAVDTVFNVSTLDFDFHAPDQGAVSEIAFLQAFHATLTNNSDADDIYTVTMTEVVPGDWSTGLCEGSTCYPPFLYEITVNLAAGAQTNLDIDLTPGSIGEGNVTITVTSGNNPAQFDTKTFGVITPGLDVLLVADDNNLGNHLPYLASITNAGKTVGTWNRHFMGSFSTDDLGEFDTVVWETGNTNGGLEMLDLAALAYYVQHGGNLFLSGQNLAFENCVASSPHYTPTTKNWFNTVLKTDYAMAEGPGDFAAGFEGDLVAGDLFFDLYGGDGLDNNLTMDALATIGDAIATIEYGSGNTAANRSSYGMGKTFVSGFAFEGIDTASNRDGLMSQVLDWFDGLIVGVDDIVSPLMLSVPYATPNPFNPQTNIRFEVGGNTNVPVDVTIYNLKGQAVRNLLRATVSPGPQNLVWNGRGNDGRTLSTGIYMARVNIADQSKTVKMTLVK